MGLRSCKEVQTLRFYQRFTIFSIRLTSPKIGQYTQLMEKFLIPIRQFLDHLAQMWDQSCILWYWTAQIEPNVKLKNKKTTERKPTCRPVIREDSLLGDKRDLWKRQILSTEWKIEEVMDG